MIDAWIQHPTPDFLEHPMFESLLRWMGINEIPDEIPLEMTIDAMKSAEITDAMICAWTGPSGDLISNDEVARHVNEYPDLLHGIGSVNIKHPVEAVREIERCVNELDFKGIRVLPWLWELPPSDRHYYPIYTKCVELNIPFCLQVGHTGPLKPSEYGRPIPYLDQVACTFPDLTIVGGHIGYPWTEEMISLARKYENVYIDTSAYKPSKYPDELVEFIKTDGGENVLFGSNFPMIQPSECLDELDCLQLSESTTDKFLRKNAKRVFALD